jgi:atypical dual specificity phosphatase
MPRKSALPPSGNWILDAQIAALSLPHTSDFQRLKRAGFGLVVNLTEDPGPTLRAAAAGLKGMHAPVREFEAPELGQMEAFVEAVERSLAQGKPVAVHCVGGLGRTGTMIAAYLVKTGMAPWDAMDYVRARRPGAIETEEQEAAVLAYARHLHKRTRGRPKGAGAKGTGATGAGARGGPP